MSTLSFFAWLFATRWVFGAPWWAAVLVAHVDLACWRLGSIRTAARKLLALLEPEDDGDEPEPSPGDVDRFVNVWKAGQG